MSASSEGASSHTLHSQSRLAPEAIDELDFAPDSHPDPARRRHRAARSGGGFLLSPGLPAHAHAHHTHHAHDTSPGHVDAHSSPASSPGHVASSPGHVDTSPGHVDSSPGHVDAHSSPLRVPKTRTASPAVDANQLVHMALNLSESRRRNISASQLLASGPRRDASFSSPAVGSSLRQYLNDQRRASRAMSPMAKSSLSRHASAALASPARPSPATLLRRDKARAYMELRAEYMRLLDFLPPLKHDANAPGNYTFTASLVPGSPHAHLTRTPSYANNKHPLGRPYNPLQALRNRRSRARDRLALPHEPAAFDDIDRVHDWIDDIEHRSKTHHYRLEDRVALPPLLHHGHDMPRPHAKPAKSQQAWSFTPEELLADAFWLEHPNNKAVIQDRHGRNIFPPRDPPKQHKHDLLAPRSSKDSSRRRSYVDAVSGTDPGTGDESDQGSDRGRKRRLLPKIRDESEKGSDRGHKRRLLPKIRADSRLRTGRASPRKHSRGYSDSSDTDHDVRKARKSFDADHNTGPLALQIKRQLELQTQALANKTPPVATPDTPDKWGRTQHDLPAPPIDEHATLKMPPRTRTNPLTPIKSADPRSSFEDDSTAPSTPLHVRHFPHIGTDLSPPPSRDGSDRGKSKRSKLNPFHALQDHDKHAQKHDQKHTEEPPEPSALGSAIFAAPSAVKMLLGHRKNDSVSSLDSPDKLRHKKTQDPKEPHSAVTRFFKGVKHEGTKVGDIIFRRDRADDTDASTVSDRNSIDLDDDERRSPALSRTVTSTTTGSIPSDKEGRSHLKLPSFRPVHEALTDDDASDREHHISRQSRQRRNDRSPRIDRLLPPRMDLERVSTASSTATLGPTRSHEQDHVKTQLSRPGGVLAFPGNLPPTALKDAHNRHRSASHPTLDGKRHWSIADDDDEHALRRRKRNAVSQADIARVRALFLCSGVKAKELARRAYCPRDPAPHFLALAAETAKQPLFPVPAKEEHVLAARILVTDLERSTAALHRTCDAFRSGTIKALNARIRSLGDALESDLMPRILDAGDRAVHMTRQVSGQGPLHVKHINDEIDRMLRQRRRHSRWVMSWGWSAVEWSIVVALRLASIVFAIYGLLKSGLVLVWAVVRWLLWL